MRINKSHRVLGIFLILALFTCSIAKSQEASFQFKKGLSKELNEISGILKEGNFLWAIVDTKNDDVYKLDLEGKIIQRLHISNYVLKDVEAITSDKDYLYIGDVGDNDGVRPFRTIIRVRKSDIPNSAVAIVKGDLIQFTFPDEGVVKKKKANNYDCEAILDFRDSIYLFTKRREDLKSALYVIPKTPGKYTARFKYLFKAKGLVTDAALDPKENKLALIGYEEINHERPFIWILSNFAGDDFFSGSEEKYELTNQRSLNWQLESIAYNDEKSFFIACEKSPDVPNTLYVIRKADLLSSEKGGSGSSEK